jgi:predicted RNA-binding protein
MPVEINVVQENIILALSALISSHDSMKERLTLLNATNAAMSDRITSLEHSLRNIIQNAQTLDDQVDNIHVFCEDLVAGNWDLQELFPNALQVTVVSHPLAICKAIRTGVDSLDDNLTSMNKEYFKCLDPTFIDVAANCRALPILLQQNGMVMKKPSRIKAPKQDVSTNVIKVQMKKRVKTGTSEGSRKKVIRTQQCRGQPGVDSSTLLYASNFSRTTCPESDRTSFQPC